jgi:ABC-type glutathione transport system ATPase component
MAFVAATELSKTYTVGTARIEVLRELSLTIEKGEMVAVVGASGGKSTPARPRRARFDRRRAIRIGDTDLAAMRPTT